MFNMWGRLASLRAALAKVRLFTMETKQAADAMAAWPGEPESTPWLVSAAAVAEPCLYLLSGVVFVAAVVLLVARTKMPGRFLLLSGVILICAPLPFFLWRPSNWVLFSVSSLAVSKLVLSSAVLLFAVGFGRLALHLGKAGRSSQ
jgi:hypothetical protein